MKKEQKQNILVLEDSKTQAEELIFVLNSHNYSAVHANNADEGLVLLKEKLPDIIISDICMPGISGFEFCKIVKSEMGLVNIPVIILTSLSDPEDIVKGLECGADTFITKPFDEELLLSKIEYLLANTKLRMETSSDEEVEVLVMGKKVRFSSSKLQVANLLFSTYESAAFHNRKLNKVNKELETAKDELSRYKNFLEDTVEKRTDELLRINDSLKNEISERKRVEANLVIAKDRAEESDRLKSAFIHNISHEIRTPMNAIIGFSSLLEEPELSKEERNSYVEMIMDGCNNLLSIVNDIVEVSNIEAGILINNRDIFSLNSIMNNTYTQFSPLMAEKGIELVLETSLADDSDTISGDRVKIIQILSNMLSNALKYTFDGVVSFGYSIKDGFIGFYVSDSGIGIKRDKFERIFDRFFQVDSDPSRLNEGTGLGLSICKAYTEFLGGKIWVESLPQKGSTFYFTIPYDEILNDKIDIGDEPWVEKGKELQKKIVLVAEDDDASYLLICNLLRKYNIEIIRASNGIEAVDLCRTQNRIDLVLMDIKMPLMDGYTATKMILEEVPDMKIIAQTAYNEDKDKALESGCSGFISKPYSKSSLEEMVVEHLSGSIPANL